MGSWIVWVVVALAVVVAGLAWLVAQGRLGGMPPLVDDRPGPDLPDTDITADDLRGLRFAVTARGYSMKQVDALLDRLANQLDGVPYVPVDEHVAWETQPPALPVVVTPPPQPPAPSDTTNTEPPTTLISTTPSPESAVIPEPVAE